LASPVQSYFEKQISVQLKAAVTGHRSFVTPERILSNCNDDLIFLFRLKFKGGIKP